MSVRPAFWAMRRFLAGSPSPRSRSTTRALAPPQQFQSSISMSLWPSASKTASVERVNSHAVEWAVQPG